MISSDPLEPGSVYAASVDDEGKVGLYRLEVGCAGGTGRLRLAGGIDGVMKESIQRAFGYLKGNKVRLGIAREFDTTDFHVEAIDLLQNGLLRVRYGPDRGDHLDDQANRGPAGPGDFG